MEARIDSMLDRLPSSCTTVFFSIVLLCLVASCLYPKHPVPANIPFVGMDASQFFARQRATLKSFTHTKQWLEEGYEKYHKANISYLAPDISGRAEILVPRSSLQWLLEQPNRVLSSAEYHHEILIGTYNFTHPDILTHPFHENVLYRSLPRYVPQLIPDLWEEIGLALDETWGCDEGVWTEVSVEKAVAEVIARVSSRMFVGAPLCRNKQYLSNMSKLIMDIVINIQILPWVPKPLWWIAAPLLCIRNRHHHAQTAKYTLPLIRERLSQLGLSDTQAQERKDIPTTQETIPNDYITWHVRLAAAEGRQTELNPDMISRRLAPVNFAGMHTTTATGTEALLDIFCFNPSKQFVVDSLREEVQRIYAECNGVWSKASLAKLIRTDSALRESIRMHNVMTKGVFRKVLPVEGIRHPVEGWTAPQGLFIGTDVYSLHRDPDLYPRPEEYDAFRFSRAKEEGSICRDGDADGNEKQKLHGTDFSTTSTTFLPFSHGRHACPGRFFASYTLKMLLAYILMNYVIEAPSERPPSRWLGMAVIPPSCTFRVKRKSQHLLGEQKVTSSSAPRYTGDMSPEAM